MNDIEIARTLGKRVFYSRHTDTIRACPENYCLAVRDKTNKNGWKVYDDGACKKYYPAIQVVIDTWGKWSTGDALAEAIADVCPGTINNHGYEVWQQ